MANMAQKRARKEQRKKQLAALARRADALQSSLAARVARAAQAPIRHCYLTESIFEVGMGTLVLVRGATSHHVALSAFLLDTFCLGIKDVMFEQIEGDALELYLEASDAASPMTSVDPSYARRLLRDLAAWSKSQGFTPHRHFAAVERIFGEVNADESDAVFQFGQDGRPVYVSGPSESTAQVQGRIEQLQQIFGPDRPDMVA